MTKPLVQPGLELASPGRRAALLAAASLAACSTGAASPACRSPVVGPSSSMSPRTAMRRPGARPSTASAAHIEAGLAL